MKGKKHLIVGNHDKYWMRKTELANYFESVEKLAEIHAYGYRMTLCHYPMMSWNQCNHGALLIYGHIHNNTNDTYWPLLQSMDSALNAGVDINGFEPVTLEELFENNRRFKESVQGKRG
jgi:calcineurin-like phosphoesterase family protein